MWNYCGPLRRFKSCAVSKYDSLISKRNDNVFKKKHILPLPSSENIVTYGLIQPTRQDSVSQPQVTLCKDLGNQTNVQNYFKFSSVIHQLYTLTPNKINSCKFKSVHLKLVVVTQKKHLFPSNLWLTPKWQLTFSILLLQVWIHSTS